MEGIVKNEKGIVIYMSTINVIFNSIEECVRYVNIVENVPFHIDLLSGNRIIDGKSMLGIMGFGLRKVLEMHLHTEDLEAEKEFLNKIDFCRYYDKIKAAMY